ncbi:MAG: alkaline phosphatase family protein [Deltaproteobacteria bacterium]|nr:alkaline phosphatase family protein [Deltaproteobacteria bacterium]
MKRAPWVALGVFLCPAGPAPAQVPSGQAPPAQTPSGTRPTPPAGSAPRPYDHVVIVSFDGLRPDAIDRADAPVLRRVRDQGAWARNAQTVPDSSTLPAHSSMLSGAPVRAHGMSFDDFRAERGFIRVPTIFYRAHDQGLRTAMFVAKTKLRHIALPGSLDVWSLPHYSCERVSAAASAYLRDAGPGVTFIHLEEPDDGGHRYGWMSRRYLGYVARADRCFGVIMATLEARADRARVLVLVSADHGGHGRRHGTHDPLDLHIPWLAWGSRVHRGPFDAPVLTTDTAATAMAALGLTPGPENTGHPVPQALSRRP